MAANSLFSRLQQLLYPILICYIAWKYYKKNQKNVCDPNDKQCADKYFSNDYKEARHKFLEYSSKIKNAATYNIPMDDNDELFTDITILNENSKSNHIILHLSGVHGVEGFTGSGIQLFLLEKYLGGYIKYDKSDSSTDTDDLPIIIFVHSVNPFGFNSIRRTNKNNVDLNRNFKTKKEWKIFSQNGKNAFYYEDISDLINPDFYLRETSVFINKYIPSSIRKYFINFYMKISYYSTFLKSIFYIYKFGFKSIKIAGNVGQMHNPNGLQYVGNGYLENEHSKLRDFLFNKFNSHSNWKKQISLITMIDVHSGDDSYGFDKLLTNDIKYAQKLKKLFIDYDEHDLIQSLDSNDNSNEKQFADGIYDNVNGYTFKYGEYIASLCDTDDTDDTDDLNILSFASEFGSNHRLETVGSVQILENSLHNSYNKYMEDTKNIDNDVQNTMKTILDKSKSWLKDVFYVQEPEWKKIVVKRGYRVFDVCYNR